MKISPSVVAVALVALPVASAQADALPGGIFDPWASYPAGPSSQAVTAGLLDADGFVDVAAAVPRQLHVFPGNGAGTLGAATVYPLAGY